MIDVPLAAQQLVNYEYYFRSGWTFWQNFCRQKPYPTVQCSEFLKITLKSLIWIFMPKTFFDSFLRENAYTT